MKEHALCELRLRVVPNSVFHCSHLILQSKAGSCVPEPTCLSRKWCWTWGEVWFVLALARSLWGPWPATHIGGQFLALFLGSLTKGPKSLFNSPLENPSIREIPSPLLSPTKCSSKLTFFFKETRKGELKKNTTVCK